MWTTLTLIVPTSMLIAIQPLVSPGGGVVVVKNGGPTGMVDIVTREDSVVEPPAPFRYLLK